MLVLVLALPIVMALGDGRQVDRGEAVALLAALSADVHDVEFRFEGDHKFLRKPDLSSLPEVIRKATDADASMFQGSTFQGTLALRDDGAIHQEVYTRSDVGEVPTIREISALLKGRRSRRVLVPDRGGQQGPDEVRPGHIGGLMREHSPLMAFQLPYLLVRATYSDDQYQFIGWEDVDGNRCLVFEFNRVAEGAKIPYLANRYWVDVKRGGHPLIVERRVDSKLALRIDNVKLTQFRGEDGAAYWFPAKARQQSYGMGFDFSRTPVSEQTFVVLDKSLHVNQKLPDARFELDWGQTPEEQARAVQYAKGTVPPPVNRPERAEARVKRILDEANEKSAQLEASSPSRASWIVRYGPQLGIATAGAILFTIAGYLRRRVA